MTTPTTAKKTRTIRTPAQVAQDALAEAQKKHAKAKATCDRLKKVAEDAEQAYQDSIAEQATTEEELAWARRNPRLAKTASVKGDGFGTQPLVGDPS